MVQQYDQSFIGVRVTQIPMKRQAADHKAKSYVSGLFFFSLIHELC